MQNPGPLVAEAPVRECPLHLFGRAGMLVLLARASTWPAAALRQWPPFSRGLRMLDLAPCAITVRHGAPAVHMSARA